LLEKRNWQNIKEMQLFIIIDIEALFNVYFNRLQGVKGYLKHFDLILSDQLTINDQCW